MNIAKIKLVYERSTKGTHVYGDPMQAGILNTLYIGKAGFKGSDAIPEAIMVTIDTTEA